MDLNIVYEDSHLITVVKPAGMPTQKDKTGDMDLYTQVLTYLQNGRQFKPFLAMIQRLDRPVGGLVLFLKTSYAAQYFAKNPSYFQKVYYGVACGQPPEQQGRLTDYLIKNEQTNISRVTTDSGKGKLAQLTYEVLASRKTEEGALYLLKIKLLTGRHHQIRVQTSAAGFPLWGDVKYNPDFKRKSNVSIALWACEITLNHPKTKKEMVCKADLPGCYPFSLFQ